MGFLVRYSNHEPVLSCEGYVLGVPREVGTKATVLWAHLSDAHNSTKTTTCPRSQLGQTRNSDSGSSSDLNTYWNNYATSSDKRSSVKMMRLICMVLL